MIQGKKIFQLVTSNEVCRIYELLHKHKLLSFPLTREGRHTVDAIVGNITGSYFGNEIYVSSEEKVIAYLYFLIKDHPFTDGNKRTASLVFLTLCDINALFPRYGDFSLDELAVFIEKAKEVDHQKVIKELAKSIFDVIK